VEFTAGGIYCVHLDPVKILRCLGADKKKGVDVDLFGRLGYLGGIWEKVWSGSN
jgi:hypothetical protein